MALNAWQKIVLHAMENWVVIKTTLEMCKSLDFQSYDGLYESLKIQ